MHVTYKTSKSTLCAYLWSDFIQGENIEFRFQKSDGSWSKEVKRKTFKDSKGIYFVWDGQKVYINDYDYPSIDKLLDTIHKIQNGELDKWNLTNDEILAGIMHYDNQLAIIVELPGVDPISHMLWPFGFCTLTEKTIPVKCALSEKQYKKHEWCYKVTLVPIDEKYKQFIPSKHYYFSDFCSLIKANIIKIERR